MSREHYITDKILRAIGDGGQITIAGLPWQSKGEAKAIAVESRRFIQTKGNDARFKKTERGKFAVGKAS
jgi:hypothetical protein